MNLATFSCIIALAIWGTFANAANCPDSRNAFNVPTQYTRATLTVWGPDGFNGTVNLNLPEQATVLDALPIAKIADPRFTFTVVRKEVDYPLEVYSINGIKEQDPYKWILYRLPSPPSFTSPPGNELRVGVDKFIDAVSINDGDHLLYWFTTI